VESEREPDGPIDSPQDLRGCFAYILRLTGCFLSIYIIMFLAVLAAALISLFFFR
jgi:hypothetical protein